MKLKCKYYKAYTEYDGPMIWSSPAYLECEDEKRRYRRYLTCEPKEGDLERFRRRVRYLINKIKLDVKKK